MIKRRAKAAGLPYSTCCHIFRATGITAYMLNGGTLEHAQQIAAHQSPRTTKLYDRTRTNFARRGRADQILSNALIGDVR
jgi:integrase/recombinase XerD